VFQPAVANRAGRIVDRHRFSRAQFGAFLCATAPAHVVIEACGTAHY